ncbi:MAG: GMC family oxidoreductase [Actinomycetota bacterium]|nr:GMC family oxidoreductase [Actinomycetota bacterium]
MSASGSSKATEDFDVVVVGSGFGASVTAFRLAEAGQRVCVLERGCAYPPGSFPRDPRGMANNLWDPQAGLHGLYDIWAFNGIESLVSSGLGGGSLIYANVLIRKDEHWFVDEALPNGGYERWPIDRALLDPHYDAVEKMLDAQRYPFDVAPYDQTPKTLAMRDAAATLGLEWMLPELAVSFRSPGDAPAPGLPLLEAHPNLHGSARETCRLCGECDAGCNYGSKNTLDFTYLSRAKDHGAEIRTLSEVRALEPLDGPGGGTSGYRVTYVVHRKGEDRAQVGFGDPSTITIKARRVVLGAGTFGTTFLLLRNRAALPRLSSALGTRFSGNGDLLSAIVGAHREVGGQDVPRYLDPSVGPVITSAIRMADSLDGTEQSGRGFYVEDGGNPAFLDWVAESAGAVNVAGRAATFLARRLAAHWSGHPRSNVTGDIAKLMAAAAVSSTAVPVLAMGRDVPDGVMRLRNGDLDIDWTTRTSEAYFERVQQTLRAIASALGGRLLNTPLWLFKRVITVHALGGCPMATNDEEGVIGIDGEVFHYPGLFVVDGAAMPGPVGPNPSFTIAAFADHVSDGIVSDGMVSSAQVSA